MKTILTSTSTTVTTGHSVVTSLDSAQRRPKPVGFSHDPEAVDPDDGEYYFISGAAILAIFTWIGALSEWHLFPH